MSDIYTIIIEPNTTFDLGFQWLCASTPAGLGAFQARLNIRASKDKNPTLITSTQNGGAASTPSTGDLYFLLTPAETSTLTFAKGYYEVEIYTTTATPYVKRLRKGPAIIDRT